MKQSWLVKPFFWFQKKRYGQILPPTYEWAKAPRVMITFLLFYKSLTRKRSPLPKGLLPLVGLRIAQMVGCEFCAEFNASCLQKQADSILTKEEKAALAFAEMMVRGERDEAVVAGIKELFSEQGVVELTAFIGCQLLSSRFNIALGVK